MRALRGQPAAFRSDLFPGRILLHAGTSSTAAEIRPPDIRGEATSPSHWRSLDKFNLFRLGIGGFLALLSLFTLEDWPFGREDALIFRFTAFAYLAAAVVFIVAIRLQRPGFRTQLSLHIFSDIVFITALAGASGGVPGGLGLLLLVPLASAGLVGQGRLSLLYAAMASMAMLGMQTMRVLQWQSEPRDYLQTALLCLSFFAVASFAHILTRRVMASQQAVEEKARELALANRIHALATGDSTDGVLATDGNGQIIYCNPQVQRLLGLAGITPGHPLQEFSRELKDHVDAWIAQTGSASALLSGSMVMARFIPLDEQGKTLILLEDPARAEALAQQVKLAALGRLTLNIAHEIRNPLSAISHAAQLIGEEAADAPSRKLTDIIQNNVYRLDRMVQDILTLNRRDRKIEDILDLGLFVRTWLDEWRQAEEIPESAVILDMDNQVSVCFSPQHLHRILWNLASNAWRYSSQQDGAIRLSLKTTDGTATLEFVDDGPGIAAGMQSRLFEPFQTSDPQGTGLGLYIARELASANHASLEFSGNQPGGCFSLKMPVHPC